MKLKELRKTFITKATIDEYLSYVYKYQKKDKEKPMPGKRKYHMLRLLFEIKRMISGKDIQVYVEGVEGDVLRKIRAEEISQEAFQELMDENLKEIQQQKPWNLPDTANLQDVDKWLVDLRKADLHGTIK